jgi:excisionase family DNA binding protein
MSTDVMLESPVLTIRESAAYLKVGLRVVRRLIRERRIAFKKIDGRGTIRIHRSALDNYILGVGQ